MTESPLETPRTSAATWLRARAAGRRSPTPSTSPRSSTCSGAIAYGEMSAFERLSRGRQDGPELADKVELARMACDRVRALRGAARPARRARGRPVRGDGAVPGAVRRLPRAYGAVRLARGPGQGVRRGRAGRGLLPGDRGVPGRGHPHDHRGEPRGRRPVASSSSTGSAPRSPRTRGSAAGSRCGAGG